MTEWESEQLDNALKQVDRGAKWADGAESSILRYAAMVGARDAVIEPIDSDSTDSSDSSDSSDSTDSSDTNSDGGVIEPLDPQD
jgi:hypothetical protein